MTANDLILPPRDEERKLVVPEMALAERMLREGRRAFMRLSDSLGDFTASLEAAKAQLAWTTDLNSKIPFWTCCKLYNRDPEDERDLMLSHLDTDMRKIVQGKYGAKCPVCHKIKQP